MYWNGGGAKSVSEDDAFREDLNGRPRERTGAGTKAAAETKTVLKRTAAASALFVLISVGFVMEGQV